MNILDHLKIQITLYRPSNVIRIEWSKPSRPHLSKYPSQTTDFMTQTIYVTPWSEKCLITCYDIMDILAILNTSDVTKLTSMQDVMALLGTTFEASISRGQSADNLNYLENLWHRIFEVGVVYYKPDTDMRCFTICLIIQTVNQGVI